jgi:SAM-dependent methyltransferase
MSASLPAPEPGSAGEWTLRLFDRSVLKQAKYRQIAAAVGDTTGKRCLDLGSDNGVISYLLRRRGGSWASADLDRTTVEAIRALVKHDAHQIDGRQLPFDDASFDVVVIVDLLEHVSDDAALMAEIRRVLRGGGLFVANVPHLKPGSLLRRLRDALGLTDAWHGHLRAGYSRDNLRQLLGPDFVIEYTRTYSGSFSMAIDTALNGGFHALQGRAAGQSAGKGTVVTGDLVAKNRKQFRLLSALYPVLWLVSRMDRLLFLQEGYMLIVRARYGT